MAGMASLLSDALEWIVDSDPDAAITNEEDMFVFSPFIDEARGADVTIVASPSSIPASDIEPSIMVHDETTEQVEPTMVHDENAEHQDAEQAELPVEHLEQQGVVQAEPPVPDLLLVATDAPKIDVGEPTQEVAVRPSENTRPLIWHIDYVITHKSNCAHYPTMKFLCCYGAKEYQRGFSKQVVGGGNAKPGGCIRRKSYLGSGRISSRKIDHWVKMVYKIKLKKNEDIDKYKTILVVKGYTQREGLDYHESFSPVAKMITVRTVISIAAANDWELFQMDVNNVFLQGDLDEDVYMSLPEGSHRQGEKRVCKLLKSLYGLKQASRQWNIKLTTALIGAGYSQSSHDHSLFTKQKGRGMVLVLIYVDDLLITGSCPTLIEETKKYLQSQFKVKDLGILKYFLGIEVMRSKSGILLNQTKYTLELIADVGLNGSKVSPTPLEANTKLTSVDYDAAVRNINNHILEDTVAYQKLFGKLID
ncbi:uncharacterized protein LOC132066399 [Lycium ferocissimum]|uniref:uncharacterized protein LOC132066399 n=1 Tax=Lycium ferocissimum TaxID=112874 RepID=UPI0028162147|nr:uncharacterized protein LOC132066399 [Lycium ferocissimum]